MTRAISTALILSALASGCGPLRPLNIVIDNSTRIPDSDIQAEIDEAGAILGVDLTTIGALQARGLGFSRRPPVLLIVVPHTSPFAGKSYKVGVCEYVIWARPDAQVIAHELGHVVGLGHSDEAGNLMWPTADPGNVDLTEEQEDRVELGASTPKCPGSLVSKRPPV